MPIGRGYGRVHKDQGDSVEENSAGRCFGGYVRGYPAGRGCSGRTANHPTSRHHGAGADVVQRLAAYASLQLEMDTGGESSEARLIGEMNATASAPKACKTPTKIRPAHS